MNRIESLDTDVVFWHHFFGMKDGPAAPRARLLAAPDDARVARHVGTIRRGILAESQEGISFISRT